MAIYMACAVDQIIVDMGDGLGPEPIADEKQAAEGAARLIEKWAKKAGCSRTIVCLSKGVTFRKKIYPAYKANRTTPKPITYPYVVDKIRDEFEVWEEDQLEADDLMGIAASDGRVDFVAVSRDKDMRTIPGLVFNPDHDRKPVRMRLGAADQMWMKQTITGDSVDNYPGIPGMGDVGAQALLLNPHRLYRRERIISKGKNKGSVKVEWDKGEPSSVWQSMVDHAAKAGMAERELITMAQVARILRAKDFDKETRTIKLWTPNGPEELRLDD